MESELLKIGPHVTVLPVVHGSGDFAVEVRRVMMANRYDCLAVPLPDSFREMVLDQVMHLPTPSVVLQRSLPRYQTEWSEASDQDSEEFDNNCSYVPIDPCQPVIGAIRTALGERMPCKFIDLETSQYEVHTRLLPDAYALKKTNIEKFAAAVLPSLQRSESAQWERRIQEMAWQLRELSVDYKNILFVCSILDWPWIRQAFNDRELERPEPEDVSDCERMGVDPQTLYFLLGELPFITQLYEVARSELESDENLSVDGVKELLISARTEYKLVHGRRARRITPKLLAQCLKYARNLTLMDGGLTPQLSTIVTAAQQVAGDGYAIEVLEKAKEYELSAEIGLEPIKMAIDQAQLPDGDVCGMVSRLPGPPLVWSQLQLIPKPDKDQQKEWKQKWNPYSQCSWPPEDEIIENFRQAVFERAQEVMGADLAKTEKFTTSVKDGIDIRDTLRHWYEGDIYVKVIPPNRGKLDAAVMLFDSPADPRDYPWRTTWFAEHKDESTLAFYATDFSQEPVGPGICLANYGGALFLYPPVAIPDIWTDPRLDFTETLEERLLAAACMHSECKHIALVSSAMPGPGWRKLAKRFGKSWVHLPLSRFSDSTIHQMRMVHVLNGKEVRSYAADFIRRV
jgi:hypothetical protein